MEEAELRDFIILAKFNSQSQKSNSNPSGAKWSALSNFSKGKLRYVNQSIGNIFRAGQEIVFENNKPIWSSVYSGGIIIDDVDSREVLNFLGSCLSEPDEEIPVRGRAYFTDGKLTYRNSANGSLEHFMGYESVDIEEEIIYELHYSGGLLLE